ncbi:MAG: YeeE/YedE family protein [Saprospiraceae bacterium]|nr:YeeE/YedE family protein [Saprospiraceae bacterium]
MAQTNFNTTTITPETDYEVRSLDTMCVNESDVSLPWYHNLKYAAVGVLFGITFVKAEIISWFRIQEMFRLQSFHMYGVIGTAVAVGALSVFLIKKFKVRTIHGEAITFQDKKFNKGQIFGGLLFGFGWAMTGACPGPLFATLGTGALAISVTILSAIAGTWVYGYFRDRLPH